MFPLHIQLATLQDLVNIKNHECELLINTHHDAIRARDAAKIELEEVGEIEIP